MRHHWRALALAACYLAAGGLILLAALRLVTDEPAHSAIQFAGIGLLMAFAGARFLAADAAPGRNRTLLLLACYAAGGALLLTGIALVTPIGPPRQFVAFAGAGALLAFLGWRFLAEREFRPGPIPNEETPQERDTRLTRDLMLTFSYVGIAGLLLYALRTVVPAGKVHDFFQIMGGGIILSSGSLLAGGLIGFLFGIPRALVPAAEVAAVAAQAQAAVPAGNARRRTAFQVNTNLEQISDWLTKIIVGLGLIHLEKFPHYFRSMGAYFGQIFGDVAVRDSIALALILLFSICGFLLGYLLTRLFLAGAFLRAETPEEELQRLVKSAGQIAPGPAAGAGERSDNVAPSEITTAQRVAQVAVAVDQTELRRQIAALAAEYDSIRDRMRYSSERTRQLESVVARMRAIALAAYGLIDELTRSPSAGDRLAAVVFLQMRPDPRWISWLGERFPVETPFIMHHAAVALRYAAERFGPEHRDPLRSAIERALRELPEAERSTRRVLEDALRLVTQPTERRD